MYKTELGMCITKPCGPVVVIPFPRNTELFPYLLDRQDSVALTPSISFDISLEKSKGLIYLLGHA